MAEKQRPNDKRISLYPLSTEEALRGLMQAGPHPKHDKPEPAEGKEKAPLRRRRVRGASSQANSETNGE